MSAKVGIKASHQVLQLQKSGSCGYVDILLWQGLAK